MLWEWLLQIMPVVQLSIILPLTVATIIWNSLVYSYKIASLKRDLILTPICYLLSYGLKHEAVYLFYKISLL